MLGKVGFPHTLKNLTHRLPHAGNLMFIPEEKPIKVRKTWVSAQPVDDKMPATKLFFFGGSTMWGTGARDDFTIPSLISKSLYGSKVNTKIVNYGESSYVSTQEMIFLINQLQQGNIPDVVVFYDGYNDTRLTYMHKRPGIPINDGIRQDEYNLYKKRALTISRNLG
jgi:lysophospholipase L1-like esterase